MASLNDMYQGLKRHTGKIVTGTVIAGALVGMRGCAKNMGEEVYRGKINDQEVVYEENRFGYGNPKIDDFPLTQRNIMTIVDGDKEYTLIDGKEEKKVVKVPLTPTPLPISAFEGKWYIVIAVGNK